MCSGLSTSFFLPDSQSTLYTNQLAQAELGLDYYVARYYNPLTDVCTGEASGD